MSPPRPEVLAFLQDIKENPDDDTPRLILADWLEEHGDPRGTFLRIQCELAKPEGDRTRRHQLGVQMRQILERHEPAWLAPFGALGKSRDYRRGLLRLALGADFLAGPAPPGLAASEEWAWVDHVQVWSYHPVRGSDLTRDLTRSGLLDNLSSLCLPECEGLAEFLARPECGRLSALELRGPLPADPLTVVSTSPHFHRLSALTLEHAGLGPQGAEVLAAGGGLRRLRWLRLQSNAVERRGVQALVQAPWMRGVTALHLEYNRIDAEGALALAASPLVENLRYLNLAGNRIKGRGAAALAESAHLSNLKALDLTACNINDDGAVALANSPTLTSLRRLELGQNNLTETGMSALAQRMFRTPQLQVELAGNPGEG
jgi:uncharacterized protein (TIGR02996 family)